MRTRWTKRISGATLLLFAGAAIALLPIPTSAKGAESVKAHPARDGEVIALLDGEQDSPGGTAYKNQCSLCHGVDRKGVPPVFPSLVGVPSRLSDAQITDIVHNGRGRMPAQPSLEPAVVTSIIAYLKTADTDAPPSNSPPPAGNRVGSSRLTDSSLPTSGTR